MLPEEQRRRVVMTKPDRTILPTAAINVEQPAHLIDDDTTPVNRLFVRNAGTLPVPSAAEIAAWALAIDGRVRVVRRWSLSELQRQFEIVTRIAVLECAGNGRAFFPEPAGNVLWRHGAA